MASTKAIPFIITPSKTTTHTAYIGRKRLHNYLVNTFSSPHSINVMRRPGKDS